MKLPSSIRVGCYDVLVQTMEDREAMSHGIYGHYASTEHIIRINEDLSPIKMLNTLMHEVMHACYDIGGLTDEDEEERIVTIMANICTQVVRDNPEYNTFVQQCIKEGK